MFSYALTYILLVLGALAILSLLILKIGGMLGTCPASKNSARAASVTVATGFATIGSGGVILIGAVLPLLPDYPEAVLMFALGLAALCLGLGFTQAIATLRAVLMDAAKQANPA